MRNQQDFQEKDVISEKNIISLKQTERAYQRFI